MHVPVGGHLAGTFCDVEAEDGSEMEELGREAGGGERPAEGKRQRGVAASPVWSDT